MSITSITRLPRPVVTANVNWVLAEQIWKNKVDFSEYVAVEKPNLAVAAQVYKSELDWLEDGGALRNLEKTAIAFALYVCYGFSFSADYDGSPNVHISEVTAEVKAKAADFVAEVIETA